MARTKADAIRNAGTESTRKKRRFKSKTIAKREVKKYQASTALVVPKMAMERLIRETVQNIAGDVRLTKNAIEALREAAEAYLVDTMEVADVMRQHAKRDTMVGADFKLAGVIMNTIFTSASE